MSAKSVPKGSSQLNLPESWPETSNDQHLGSNEQEDLAAAIDADQTGPFEDSYEILDDVHGSVELNQLEIDAIDSPEFQRLFRLGQLGFVDLVYPTANHTRATHSIGACHFAKKLIRALRANTKRLNRRLSQARVALRPEISEAERVLISLAGLLHDIPHGPFSHDIEKKTHYIYPQSERKKIKSFYGPYEKHDNFEENPALFVFLMDVSHSVLARVLERHSPEFARLLVAADVKKHPHLAEFIKALPSLWPNYKLAVLPSLLFHLLVWEKPDEEYKIFAPTLRKSFSSSDKKDEWGLGPRKNWEALHRLWYQPFRHDIVGDTLSADLIDYLVRDQARLGMKNQLDLKLLQNYILVPWRPTDAKPENPPRPQMYRCAIDLNDHKRGTFRAERLNDIFRLLDLRHQIHEKAVYHRVVQSAIAMLSRASLMHQSDMPDLRQLYGLDKATVALAGDDGFLQHLLDAVKTVEGAKSLPCKIAERRVYRPLMVVPGDRVKILLRNICDFKEGLQDPLREIAAIIDSPFFARFFLLISACIETLLTHAFASEEAVDDYLGDLRKDRKRLERVRVPEIVPKRVIFWTTPYKQLYKDPAILVCVNDKLITTIECLQRDAPTDALRARVTAGVSDAETKNEGLWKFYVFLSDGLFYSGALAHVIPDHPCANDLKNHKEHLLMAQNVVVRAVRSAWEYWQVGNKSVDLSSDSTPEDLADLLEVFSSTLALFRLGHRDIPGAVSAVRVDQYLHADGSASCRDVRYKFDTVKDLDAVLKEVVLQEERRASVKQAVRATGVNPKDIMGEEMTEIVSRLASVSDEHLSELIELVSRNRPASEERLMALWRPDLP